MEFDAYLKIYMEAMIHWDQGRGDLIILLILELCPIDNEMFDHKDSPNWKYSKGLILDPADGCKDCHNYKFIINSIKFWLLFTYLFILLQSLLLE